MSPSLHHAACEANAPWVIEFAGPYPVICDANGTPICAFPTRRGGELVSPHQITPLAELIVLAVNERLQSARTHQQ
jgi:hypothetical protein